MNTIPAKRAIGDTFENPRKIHINEESAEQTISRLASSHLKPPYSEDERAFISVPTNQIHEEYPLFKETCELTHQVHLDLLSDSTHSYSSTELTASEDTPELLPSKLKNLLENKSVCKFVDFIEGNLELATKHKKFIIENSKKFFLCRGAYRAISKNQLKAAVFLLKSGADPNWKNTRGEKCSLLQVAIREKNRNSIQILLQHEATVDSYQNKNGDTILHLAKKHFRTDAVFIELAEKAGEKAAEILQIKNKEDKTPGEISTWNKSKEKNIFLKIQKNRDEKKLKTFVKGKNPDFLSARASSAISNNWYKAVGIILKAGANVEWKLPQNGKTLLSKAASIGHLEVTSLLLTYGAKINTQDDNGDTPLHHAFRSGKPGVYELLTKSAGNKLDKLLEIKNKEGETPEEVKQRVRKSQSKYK